MNTTMQTRGPSATMRARRASSRLAVAAARLVAVAAVAALLAVPSAAYTGTETARTTGRISVGRAVTVDGSTVRLADVAVLEGSAGDFADLDLGPAPDPGGSRRLDGVAILRKLRAAGLDDGATRYEIPAMVRVARAYQDVAAEDLRSAVERDAAAMLAAGEQLRAVDVGGAARIPPGPYEVRLAATAASARGPRRKIDVELVQDGSVIATVPARLDVVATGSVVVLRHAVARGTILGPGDIGVDERELTGLPGTIVGSVAEAIGKETRAALPAGAPLTLAALASPVLVRRGDVVSVVIETPGMRLSTAGEALEAGAAGAAIRVRNRTSQQELSGQVVERGTVLVQY